MKSDHSEKRRKPLTGNASASCSCGWATIAEPMNDLYQKLNKNHAMPTDPEISLD